MSIKHFLDDQINIQVINEYVIMYAKVKRAYIIVVQKQRTKRNKHCETKRRITLKLNPSELNVV